MSSVEVSIAQAAEVPEANPWYRGVYADGEPVGFVPVGTHDGEALLVRHVTR